MPPAAAAALRVLWSDGRTLVLNKPAGVAVQEIPSLLNRLLRRPALAAAASAGAASVAQPEQPVWLPHRIDKYTRGLQVVTVNKTACAALNRSSEQRRWHKRYRALACVPSDPGARGRSPLVGADGSLVPEGWLVSGIVRRPLHPGAPATPVAPATSTTAATAATAATATPMR